MKFKQGYYIPKNPQKYIHINNHLNEDNEYPKYRSSWELKFFKFLDNTESIKYWTSEPFGIKYFHPFKQKVCNYYPDFLFKKLQITPNGEVLQTYLIEIKPKSQTTTPKSQYDKVQYLINKAKWEAAFDYCSTRNIKFCILTESELGI